MVSSLSLLLSNKCEHFLSLTCSSIFKTVGVTTLPVPKSLFVARKSGEHDVTLTSFADDQSHVGSQCSDVICKIYVGDDFENLVTIPPLFREISWKTRWGSKKPPPPVGRGLSHVYTILCVRCWLMRSRSTHTRAW